jgi:hypothetical protein
VNELHLPAVFVESLVRWSDVQSLSFRMSEGDVSFKMTLARRYLGLVIALYRMLRSSSDPCRLLTMGHMALHPESVAVDKSSAPSTLSSTLSPLSPRPSSDVGCDASHGVFTHHPAVVTVSPSHGSHTVYAPTYTHESTIGLSESQIALIHRDLMLDEGLLAQMLGLRQRGRRGGVDLLDEEDSMNEYAIGGEGGHDQDTETELPGEGEMIDEGGTFAGSDEDDDN